MRRIPRALSKLQLSAEMRESTRYTVTVRCPDLETDETLKGWLREEEELNENRRPVEGYRKFLYLDILSREEWNEGLVESHGKVLDIVSNIESTWFCFRLRT